MAHQIFFLVMMKMFTVRVDTNPDEKEYLRFMIPRQFSGGVARDPIRV